LSPDDPDTPVHRVSRVEDRERLLAEAMAHSEEADKQYRISFAGEVTPPRWKTPVAVGIFAVAVLLLLSPPGLIAPTTAPRPTPADLERGLRITLALQAEQVEVFRARTGALPQDVSQLPVRIPGLRLVRSNSRVYQLVGDRPDGTPMLYDSARPRRELAPEIQAWLTGSEP
jgi:hypothetical protein